MFSGGQPILHFSVVTSGEGSGTVKDHQGFIDVYSEVGRGTTFTLYFPITREPTGEAVPPTETGAAPQGVGRRRP